MKIQRLALAVLLGSSFVLLAQEKSVKPGINDPFKDPNVKEFLGKFEVESREIYAQRKEIVAVPLKLWLPGLVLVVLGMLLHMSGYLLQEPRISVVALFVGIYGLMGAGRSELFECLSGLHPEASGEIYLNGQKVVTQRVEERIKQGLVLIPEDRQESGIVQTLSVNPSDPVPSLFANAWNQLSPILNQSLSSLSPQLATQTTLEMYEITADEHEQFTIPALNFRGTPLGIDVRKVMETGILPQINTGIAHKKPGIGQVGAGIASVLVGSSARPGKITVTARAFGLRPATLSFESTPFTAPRW